MDRFLRMMLNPDQAMQVRCYKRFSHDRLRSGDSRHVIHQFTDLKEYESIPAEGGSLKTYRAVAGSYRFSGPVNASAQLHPILLPATSEGGCLSTTPPGDSLPDDVARLTEDSTYLRHVQSLQDSAVQFDGTAGVRTIVLYDRGNGFADYKNKYMHYEHCDDTEPETEEDSPVSQSAGALSQDPIEGWKYLFLHGTPEEIRARHKSGDQQRIADISHVFVSVKNIPDPRSWNAKHDSSGCGHKIIDFMIENDLLSESTIVLDANDLRASGAHITRGASWERTATDTLRLFQNHPFLLRLLGAHKIVIRFGISGAIVRQHSGNLNNSWIIYDPATSEQGFADASRFGTMYPMDAVLLSTLTAEHVNNWTAPKDAGNPSSKRCITTVKKGLSRCRTFYQHGWNPKATTRDSIEKWDQDHQNLPKYDPLERMKNQRATVLGSYSYEDWDDRRTQLQFEIYINDEYEFGQLINSGRLSLAICKSVAEELFCERVSRLLKHVLSTADLPQDTFSIGTDVFDGRTAKVPATITIQFSCDAIDAITKVTKLVEEKLIRGGFCFKEHSRGDDRKRWRSEEHLSHAVKCLVMQEHEFVSQQIHHRLFAPVTFMENEIDMFSSSELDSGSGEDWAILPADNSRLYSISRELVVRGFGGLTEIGIERFPIAQFGTLTVVDRNEIENYRDLNQLVRNYLKRPSPERPLCSAVFGPPGSGKSFGVKQLAQSAGINGADILEYNLSQFERKEDLERAFINVRNACSPSRTPLVFFDEFDSSLGKESLGWLKMFLSVMQDGTFSLNGDIMQLGKSILIFAGGTSETFGDFIALASEGGESAKYFRAVKGPDFVSRLRGYIDIASINPSDALQRENSVHYLRRAAIVRSIIKREYPGLLDGAGVASIDEGVLNAILKVSCYTHGARSLSALFDMSNLVGKKRFDRSQLPSENQLAMHLEHTQRHDGVKEFFRLVNEA